MYQSILINAYMFKDDNGINQFWSVSADAYVRNDDPDDPVRLEISEDHYDADYTEDDLLAALIGEAETFKDDALSVTILIEGDEAKHIRSAVDESDVSTCGNCGKTWNDEADPSPSALCHWCHGRGRSTHEVKRDNDQWVYVLPEAKQNRTKPANPSSTN